MRSRSLPTPRPVGQLRTGSAGHRTRHEGHQSEPQQQLLDDAAVDRGHQPLPGGWLGAASPRRSAAHIRAGVSSGRLPARAGKRPSTRPFQGTLPSRAGKRHNQPRGTETDLSAPPVRGQVGDTDPTSAEPIGVDPNIVLLSPRRPGNQRCLLQSVDLCGLGDLGTDTSRDYVYTERDGVKRFAEDFLADPGRIVVDVATS